MFRLKNYKMGFDLRGLAVFLAILLPNIIWAALSPSPDPLAAPTVTPALDLLQTVFQVLMAASLCALVNTGRRNMTLIRLWPVFILVLLYYAGWCLYFTGIFNPPVVLMLCVCPSLAFVIFAWARKNAPAFLAAALFMICHVWRSLVNFIL